MAQKTIKSALISVYHKEGLESIVKKLIEEGVKLISTGGTQKYLESLGASVIEVESLTGFPSILGGRVKTLHPGIFGGILRRDDVSSDQKELEEYKIPEIDLVIVDLYPFEETVAQENAEEQEIIEKIDIGGISLIRAAAKNFKDVLIVPSKDQYQDLELLLERGTFSSLEERKAFAAHAFNISSHYDTQIFNYFNTEVEIPAFKQSYLNSKKLRYGENPHQEGHFFGNLDEFVEQIHGKEISYNNLVDIHGAVNLVEEFNDDTFFGILKHTNACGASTGNSVLDAYKKALAADPVSAFGGILVSTHEITKEAAEEMHSLFFEVLVAPSFSEDALTVLKQKKNRILLVKKDRLHSQKQFKSLLNGVIEQDKDSITDQKESFKTATSKSPTESELNDLEFASKICKQTKSNTIVLAKDGQMLSSGVGQTSRVDALEQAIKKAKKFNFDVKGAVMASDAFFPFPDCVEIAHSAGIMAVIQPGGSIKDQNSIDFCNKNEMSMVFTGIRHFLH
ncbi:MAG: bifunctional phosphoribosylaminoimidazolecarboxamide formyltransferase/IMP cyclohydrolase [Bacteroidota bacterium]